MSKPVTQGCYRVHWVPFPYVFELADGWEEALVNACAVFKEHYPCAAWFISIPTKHKKPEMVEFAKSLGLVEKHVSALQVGRPVFFLGAPSKEWLRDRRRRVDFRDVRTISHDHYTEKVRRHRENVSRSSPTRRDRVQDRT